MMIPLCVDLDGTLLRSDLLSESLLYFLKTKPLQFPKAIFWLFKGRAYFKHKLAKQSEIDISLLPFNQPFLTYCREQKKKGRKLVLASASDGQLVNKIARHLGIFDEVFASDGVHNLKGRFKKDALVKRFGNKG